MKVIGTDMVKFFPQLSTLPPLTEDETLKYPYSHNDFSFDKTKNCFIVGGGEVYVHTSPSEDHNGRPNCCEHCIYATNARFGVRKSNGLTSLQTVCRGLTMCKSVHRLFAEQLKGKSLFFRDSPNYKTHKEDKITKEVINV